MTYSMIGEKTKPEPVCNGPLNTQRTATDVPFLALFCFAMFIWVLVSTYAFVAGDVLEPHYSDTFHHKEFIELSQFLYHNLLEARFLIAGLITLALLFQIAYIALFRWATKALLLVTFGFVAFILIVDHLAMIRFIFNGDDINVYLYAINLAITAIFGMIMYAFKKIGTEMVCKVVKESCKAMFFFPSTLYFTFCQFVLHLLVVIYAIAVFEYLRAVQVPATGFEPRNTTWSWNENTSSSEIEANDEYEAAPVEGETPGFVYAMHAINFVCFMWASSFISGLGRTVLTAAFATWYQVKDENEAKVPQRTVFRCFFVIASFHAGTIAYASSIFSLVPMVDIVCRYARDTLKKIYKRPVLLMSWLTVLVKFSFDALAMCAIHGSPFYQSAKDSYVLLMKNPMSYLAVNTVSECVIFIGLLLVPILSISSSIAYCYNVTEDQGLGATSATAILIVAITSVLMSLTCFMVFRAASNAIRCCVLEDSKFNHEAEMKLYEIHVDDISIRDESNGGSGGGDGGGGDNDKDNKDRDDLNGIIVIKEENGITVIAEDK